MSNASPRSTDAATSRQLNAQSLLALFQWPIRWLGFWAAIVLPFVLLALLVTGVAQQVPTLLAGLLVANVTGLVLGREYNR